MTEVPAAPTVAVVPDKEITDGVPEEYVNVPGVEVSGAVRVKLEAPVFLEKFDQVKVGVNLAKGFNAEKVIPLFVRNEPQFRFPVAS